MQKSQNRNFHCNFYFKKEDAENLKDWRPISLLNADYKLIAKVISQRLRVVMPYSS